MISGPEYQPTPQPLSEDARSPILRAAQRNHSPSLMALLDHIAYLEQERAGTRHLLYEEMLRHPVALPEHDRWRSDACVLALAWDTLAYRLGPEHSTIDMMRQIEASHGLADPLRRARELA